LYSWFLLRYNNTEINLQVFTSSYGSRCIAACDRPPTQGRKEGGKEVTIPLAPSNFGAPNHCGCRITAGAPKRSKNVSSTFFNAVNLLPQVRIWVRQT